MIKLFKKVCKMNNGCLWKKYHNDRSNALRTNIKGMFYATGCDLHINPKILRDVQTQANAQFRKCVVAPPP